MKHPTCKKIKEWLADEKQASSEYKSYGFTGPSKDEHRHLKFMKRLFKQKRC